MKFIVAICAAVLSALLPNSIAMEYLNNGQYKIPVLGLGTFLVQDKNELTDALNEALKLGYRHIDTAAGYMNEQYIGEVLKEWISSGKVKREDFFITTKLSPLEMAPGKVENALKTSLEKLQLDYVDLYLIHSPMAFNVGKGEHVYDPTDHVGVWKKMEEHVDAGRARTIGLSNYNISQIQHIQKNARIQPVNLQIEVHVYHQQRPMREFASKNNITIVAYAPLGNPGLSKMSPGGEDGLKSPKILEDEKIKNIANKHNKSSAQIAIKFLIQSGLVTIPKSSNPKRLKENIDVFDFVLDEDDLKILESLDKGTAGRIFDVKKFNPKLAGHPDYPYRD